MVSPSPASAVAVAWRQVRHEAIQVEVADWSVRALRGKESKELVVDGGSALCESWAAACRRVRDESRIRQWLHLLQSSLRVQLGFVFLFWVRQYQLLSPKRSFFFIINAFAAGVILLIGFIHVLPDAFESLTSPHLSSVAMVSAIGTLMVDAYATSHYNKKSSSMAQIASGDEGGVVPVHTHPTHGHAHGSASVETDSGETQVLRHRVISQVLEIIVHSVIIGIALGASESPKTIKPLIAALTFHQFFEGIGLGGCITQAKFKSRAVVIMAIFFSLTTPIGIVIGIGISNIYSETSPTALIIEGIFNSASAGILIYMALVDLLSADFISPKMQGNGKLQSGANVSLLLGAGCMSLLAKWA
ncbi:zinc transporter 5-like [Olea europaea subsp. europaea]|uniref:Zinc transporter 5-like n=1 Tax=Olea europaea subsp. europaea TaxID=158383 RepID=A0A8S0VPE5_OLEEU|nr:zinc transporter 5-like [Olea europaea subsp. europaea]